MYVRTRLCVTGRYYLPCRSHILNNVAILRMSGICCIGPFMAGVLHTLSAVSQCVTVKPLIPGHSFQRTTSNIRSICLKKLFILLCFFWETISFLRTNLVWNVGSRVSQVSHGYPVLCNKYVFDMLKFTCTTEKYPYYIVFQLCNWKLKFKLNFIHSEITGSNFAPKQFSATQCPVDDIIFQLKCNRS